MDTLDGIKTIVAVVETGSFTAAGERLGLSKALISKYVGTVENQFGVRLFNRSTRKIAPTEAGVKYYNQSLVLLSEFSSLVDVVSEKKGVLKGSLKISTSVTFGELLLAPKLPLFIETYPDLHLDVQLTNRKIDLLEEGVDLAIRVGETVSSNLISRKLSEFSFKLCASPIYISRYGAPQNPSELTSHQCIIDSNLTIKSKWPFKTCEPLEESVEVQPIITINSPQTIRKLAVKGLGIALLPTFMIQDDLHTGKLIELLPNQTNLSFSLYAIIPHREYIPNKVRLFIDFLTKQFDHI
ncbi:LysR family transcriptional regulator [Teredinibacter sp. KSP-S5-2]|uniref:LysR family transcriptional regulator n=1 Tax=Teredinibacter sp. KSP-S5-2 TaxID=3034506 RepID=UPI0029343A2B|nr:LysR family transcriptional regulator [Teredinibacter sp. KSP-S5-2]WNO10757.1 LysR family transcriptional regulator [Teredinibacter sp. KSP-S5-2]